MNDFQLPQIKNVAELKLLFEQYGEFLSPENAALISSLISEMEKGDLDKNKIRDIASSLEKNADEERNHL